jgi:hypothetical protein
MSETLQRAMDALLDAPVDHGAAAITRSRVLSAYVEHRSRRSRWRRWAWIVGFSVSGSTVMAAVGTQAFDAIRRPSSSAVASGGREPKRNVAPRLADAPALQMDLDRPIAHEPNEEVPLVDARPVVDAPRPASVSRTSKAARAQRTDTPAIDTMPADAADLRAYRHAHDLHFVAADYALAVAAFEAYLDAFPRGRFRLEAEYNRAIGLLRLGRTAAAEDALWPFETGTHGNYRRREAQKLRAASRAAATGEVPSH